ncbi:DUF3267 domain-containing protein [Clostridium sp. D2Q-11]|uniref:DUF3267 domain-containing protein n=1 Tax=Anaeromonas frigoriresistens TaxID=2683708 RepID=A0A942UTF1_9FIRM|nr:DUF3267 domain-containing protein [Anaeromonas frigoriresistens]MBS4537100.1 DUF3267 domain-containing protein [Anaeromonas frigoriresistens]
MKYAKTLPEGSEEKKRELLSNGWNTLKEPDSIRKMILYSIPFMIINIAITILMINIVSPFTLEEFGIMESGVEITLNFFHLLGLILMTSIHELMHLVFVPNFIRSDKTYIGLTLFEGFVHTEEKVKRNRFILISLAPFVILSIILPLVLVPLGLLTTSLKVYMILNAAGASVDVLNILLIYPQVPSKALITNNGIKSYWKEC